MIFARKARGLENIIARYQLSAPRARILSVWRAAASDDIPLERSELSQDFPDESSRSAKQSGWKNKRHGALASAKVRHRRDARL